MQPNGDCLPLNAVPRPCQRPPLDGTKLDNGFQWNQPSGRNRPCPLTRRNGCHPSPAMASNSHFAYRPRSASTITVHPAGRRPLNCSSNACHSGFQACCSPAFKTFQATGTAQPR